MTWNNQGALLNSAGYCPHGNNVFGTWHRPYLAVFEQALYINAQEVVASFPSNQQARWQAALNCLRLRQKAVEAFPPLTRQPGRRVFDQSNHPREDEAGEEKASTSSRRQRPISITIPPRDFSPPVVLTGQSTWRADSPTARRYSELLIDSMVGELRREAARWRQVELGFTPAAESARVVQTCLSATTPTARS